MFLLLICHSESPRGLVRPPFCPDHDPSCPRATTPRTLQDQLDKKTVEPHYTYIYIYIYTFFFVFLALNTVGVVQREPTSETS